MIYFFFFALVLSNKNVDVAIEIVHQLDGDFSTG